LVGGTECTKKPILIIRDKKRKKLRKNGRREREGRAPLYTRTILQTRKKRVAGDPCATGGAMPKKKEPIMLKVLPRLGKTKGKPPKKERPIMEKLKKAKRVHGSGAKQFVKREKKGKPPKGV